MNFFMMAGIFLLFRAIDAVSVKLMTYGTLIRRFLAAGVAAGLVFGLWLWLVGEPVIRAALAFEETLPSGVPTRPEMFSRSTQLVGGMLAVLVFGVLLAFLFGTFYAAIRHRIVGRGGDQIAVLTGTGVAFVITAVVPAIKYPGNPPGIGDPDTVMQRSLAYLTLVIACLAVVCVVAATSSRLKDRIDDATRLAVAVVAAAAAIWAIMLIWPDTNDVLPDTIPAPLVWSFRVGSLGGLALYWGTLGLLSGWLLSRVSATSLKLEAPPTRLSPTSTAAG